ncbi:hypothetical protein M9H77_00204 [Catharanthus roseus]|nr:hypothetical protein M9H77_00204 [Catharanthus roseus]
MSANTEPIDPNVNPYGYMGFVKNPDGSLTRLPPILPETPASDDPANPFHLSKDITINQSNNTWVRLFVPRKSFQSDPGSKLPILIYFHGGGFVVASPASTVFYNIYNGITTQIPAIVVAGKYRLAPEHRLPAAYEDSMEVLHWIKNSDDEWLTKYGDVSKCFLMGTSAGGNMSLRVGLLAASSVDDLKPLEIKGLILHHPFFGGKERTDSELRLQNDKILPLSASDLMWDLCLPIGADRDHEYSNPMMMEIKRDIIDQIKLLGWKILVTGCNGDPSIDRQIDIAKKLEEIFGVLVMSKFEEGGYHGYDLFDPSKTKALINLVKEMFSSLAMSAYPDEPIDPNVDPYGYMGFVKNPDGSLTRLPPPLPDTPASDDPTNPFHLSKDITINQSNKTWVRLFVPRKSFDSEPITKLPILIYFHGGGFLVISAASSVFYSLYNGLTIEIPAIVVSVEYRLAPEHRLPAAYDDSMEVLHWIKNSDDEWLTKYGDVSKCFLMGTSAGGNISLHVGLLAASSVDDLKPLEIKGLILHCPFFGGKERTDSELRMELDKVLPLCVTDIVWDLSLPIGTDRDHEYSNPMMMGIKRDIIDQIKRLGWKILVTGCDGDPLIDRQIEIVKKLEEFGVSVVSKFEEGGFHGFDILDPCMTRELIKLVKEFVESSLN